MLLCTPHTHVLSTYCVPGLEVRAAVTTVPSRAVALVREVADRQRMKRATEGVRPGVPEHLSQSGVDRSFQEEVITLSLKS